MKENYNNSLMENKVLILYILNSIGKEIIDNDLFKIISTANDMNYFYFSELLADLVESNLVGKYTKDDQVLVEITSNGKKSLELTIDVLPGLLKLKADNSLKKELSDIVEESSITAEYIPENENDYTVKCKIVENNKTVFELKTFAGSNEQAKRIADNWKNNANTIYPQILNLLDFKE